MSDTAKARAPISLVPESASRAPITHAPEGTATALPEAHSPVATPAATPVPLATVANDKTHTTGEDKIIEQHLAKYFGERVGKINPEIAKGLMLDVIVAPSNAITGGADFEKKKDIKLRFFGTVLNQQDSANQARDAIYKVLSEHPAFAGFSYTGQNNAVLHTLDVGNFGLDEAQVALLKSDHPETQLPVHGTPLAHASEAAVTAQPAQAIPPAAITPPPAALPATHIAVPAQNQLATALSLGQNR